jgi:hypothetical protein
MPALQLSTPIILRPSKQDYADLRVKRAHQPALPLRISSGLYPAISRTPRMPHLQKVPFRGAFLETPGPRDQRPYNEADIA